jgi:hypothetical protein
MAYQQDTLVNVLARGLARSESLSAEQLEYLGTQIAAYLATISGFSGEAEQALTHAEGVLEWVTGVNDEITLAAVSAISVTNGIVSGTTPV